MMSPRVRRLKRDYEAVMARFGESSLIRITGTAGLPPEHYRFTFLIKGLYVDPTGDVLERDSHILEVNLSLDYPRRAPQCRMLTPVFHPNFDDASVCIGDFWAASEGLDDLIARIGRMIAYQEYNTRSPLNGLAAKWAAEHINDLPIDSRVVAPVSEEVIVKILDSAAVNVVENKEAAPPADQSVETTPQEVVTAGIPEDPTPPESTVVPNPNPSF
jgi:ubiquitin-protein ligase